MNSSSQKIEILSFDGERYVIGDSLAKAAGVAPEKIDAWLKYRIEKEKLIFKKDFFDFGEGILFTPEKALCVFENAQQHKAPPRGKLRETRFKLDEYGLPLQSAVPEKKAPLINPYSLKG